MKKTLPKVELYSDWWAAPNPWKAGYGIILCYKDIKKEFNQGYTLSTNNRMEMTGVITGLSKLKTKSQVEVYTDSQYTINGIEKWWALKWRENNWMRTKSEKATNYDLWKILLELTEKHEVKFHWVKWHNWHIENERCDELATLALEGDDLIEDTGFEWDTKPHPQPLSFGGEGSIKLYVSPKATNIYSIRKDELQSPWYVFDLAKEFRKSPTKSEERLWKMLKNNSFKDYKFRRQHPIGRYIADFYCEELHIIIELDWKVHEDNIQKWYDEERNNLLNTYWFDIVRIPNENILGESNENIFTLLEEIIFCPPLLQRRGVRGEVKTIKKKNTNKISKTWDICWKCDTPVVKKIPKKKKLKPEQTFYYEYFFNCPWCKTNYMVPEWKREVKK